MNDDSNPFLSRKFLCTLGAVLLVLVFPIVYHHVGLSENVIIWVGGSITALVSGYNASNAIAKKYDNSSGGPSNGSGPTS